MRQKFAAIVKISSVIEAAASEPAFAQALRQTGTRALSGRGLDLSSGEEAALVDILNGTSTSPYAVPPPGWPNVLQTLRKKWLELK